MKDAYERMPESFLDWLDECPVRFDRIKINENTVHYSFDAPYEEDEGERNIGEIMSLKYKMEVKKN